MKKIILIGLLVIIAVGFALSNSKKKAEQVALPVMEQCWNNDNLKIVSLTTRLNLKEGFNWLVKGNYTEKGFPSVIKNPKYGDVPEMLISIFNHKVVWKHFEEIGESAEGCGN